MSDSSVHFRMQEVTPESITELLNAKDLATANVQPKPMGIPLDQLEPQRKPKRPISDKKRMQLEMARQKKKEKKMQQVEGPPRKRVYEESVYEEPRWNPQQDEEYRQLMWENGYTDQVLEENGAPWKRQRIVVEEPVPIERILNPDPRPPQPIPQPAPHPPQPVPQPPQPVPQSILQNPETPYSGFSGWLRARGSELVQIAIVGAAVFVLKAYGPSAVEVKELELDEYGRPKNK
jgi:hypothetical protein